MPNQEEHCLEYYRSALLPLQSAAILPALIAELELLEGHDAMIQSLRAAGARCAGRLRACATLEESVEEMNRRLAERAWGWCAIGDEGTTFRIVHRAPPLALADGETGRKAAAAFLEGLYTAWFHSLGANPELAAIAVGSEDDAIILRFGRVARIEAAGART